MNSNPYTVPAFIFVVAVLFGCGAWAFLVITRQPPSGKHARRAAGNAEGDRFVAELRGEDPPPEEQPGPPGRGDPDDTAWWDVTPPQPPAVEVLTGPGAPSPQTSDTPIGVLAAVRDALPPDACTLGRIRDALLPDAWKPEPGHAVFTPADPDATMTDIPAVQDAPQYLAAPQ